MRISTAGIYDASINQMNSLQGQLAKTQMQLSTQKRLLTPSDDPVASARALEVTQSQAMNEQFATNRTNARNSLAQEDGALSNVANLLTNVKTLVVRAGNPALSPADRNSLATELEGRLKDLIGLANTTDGSGTYLFSGYEVKTAPFTQTATGAAYNGDQGQRDLQIGPSRTVSISDSGSAIFENNVAAKGTFKAGAAAGNTGGATLDNSMILDRSQLTGHDYALKFSVTGAGTTYDVIDNSQSPAATVKSAQPYVDGDPIVFDGLQLTVKGAPADGDQFDVNAIKKQSVFTTLQDLVQTLRAPVSGANGPTGYANALAVANDNVTTAMDTALTVQSSVGVRLQELDTLDTAGDQLDLQYASTLSDLQDLDVVKAISMFSQQQTALDAAQKSFKVMSGLSLFNYIG